MKKELENIRKCVLTGNIGSRDELLRFSLLPGGIVVPDFGKKLDGRGFYISNSKKLIEKLLVKNPLNKILHTKTVVTEDLPQNIETVLRKKGLDAVNLARKAGSLILGFEKVKEAIIKNKVECLVIAADAGVDGKQKISEISKELPVFMLYEAQCLEQALNRDNTIYMAIQKSPIGQMAHTALRRYQTFLDE